MTAKDEVERLARVPSSFTPEQWVKHLKDVARVVCPQRAKVFRRAARMVRVNVETSKRQNVETTEGAV